MTTKHTVDELTLRTLCSCHRALDDKKAEDVCVLDVRNQSSVTDYLVLASGTSEPHLRSLQEEVEKVFKEDGIEVIGVEKRAGSGWTIIDTFDVMIHLFTADNRDFYRLDSLWKDGVTLNLEELAEALPH